MSSTTFVDGQTVIFADWLNDVNDFVYKTQVNTYAELRASTVNTKKVEVIGAGIAGEFLADPADTTSGAWFVGSISGTTLTVSSVTNGSIAVGRTINDNTGTTVGYVVSGSGSTWTLSASATRASMTMSADNGGTLLVRVTDGLRLKRPTNGELNIRHFGAKCDSNGTAGNGTDDTYPVHAAMREAIAVGGYVLHPGGICRVTFGFTQTTSQSVLTIRGNGDQRDSSTGRTASTFMLDNTTPVNWAGGITDYSTNTNFFHRKLGAYTRLNAEGVDFKCAQFVKDRGFFLTAPPSVHWNQFLNVRFDAVERPFLFLAGSGHQSDNYTNVEFLNSGTFHAENDPAATGVGMLRGTLVTLINCNHEGSVPDNSEKVVCNLSYFRNITGLNFLLEGISPGAGWTVLKLYNKYGADWMGATTFDCTNLHIEFAGAEYDYSIDQESGYSIIRGINSAIRPNANVKLSGKARLVVESADFTQTVYDPSTCIQMDSTMCLVEFVRCGVRSPYNAANDPRIQYIDCFHSSSNNTLSMARYSAEATDVLYEWRGYNDSREITTIASSGTAISVATDATYGRKMVITPNASAAIDSIHVITGRPGFLAGDQFNAVVRAKLPIFAAGTVRLDIRASSGTLGSFAFDTTRSGQIVTCVFPFRLAANQAAIGFGWGSTGGVLVGDLEILHMAMYRGPHFKQSALTVYPPNIEFTNVTAAPNTGTYAVGDRAIRVPVVGSPRAWSCTVAGGATSTTRANSTAYALGVWATWTSGTTVWSVIRPGTSDATPPSIVGLGVGDTVVDGTVTWQCRSLTTATFVSEGNL